MNSTLLRDITEDEIKTFEKDGVVCLRGILDGDWVTRMCAAIDRLIAAPTQWAADYAMLGRYDQYMYLYDDDFRDVGLFSPIGIAAAEVMRTKRATLLWDFFLVKEPGSTQKTFWHQDFGFNWVDGWQTSSTWVPLDVVTIESGAVEYIRGSHRWGRRFEPLVPGTAFADLGEDYDGGEEMPNIEADRDKYEIVHFNTQPGDCVIHHFLTVHGAPSNSSVRRRRALCHRFAGDDAKYAIRRNRFRIQPPVDPGLKNGDRFPPNHDLFPTVWPRSTNTSVRRLAPPHVTA
jgi:hypothetical protein